jgi:hypothetical protein
VVDPEGRTVVLTDDVWAHIMRRHPEMSRYEQAIMETITNPDRIDPDPRPGRERFLGYRRGPSMWLRVVVSFAEEGDGRIVTAYGRRGTA